MGSVGSARQVPVGRSIRCVFLFVGAFVAGCAGDARPPPPAATETEDPSPQGTIVVPQTPVDDRVITISRANLEAKRRELIEYLWGPDGLPNAFPLVTRGVPAPVDGLGNLKRVDELRVAMDGGETNIAQHFIAERSNDRLVILSMGHTCSISDAYRADPTTDKGYGQYRTLYTLLAEGYSVLVTYMPHMSPEACGDVGHKDLLAREVTAGHPMKWFLEPVAVSLNYLRQEWERGGFPRYRDYSMLGLSGGGWTTTVYAAIDPRIQTSIPVAGSTPLYLRAGPSFGDLEQSLTELYTIAGYPDLYVLGAAGRGRRQIQVLNRKDGCCFGESEKQYDAAAHGPWDVAMRDVELRVQDRLAELGDLGGAFRLEIDEAARQHTISWSTLISTILAELEGRLRSVGAGSAFEAYVRHHGTLWEWSPGGWADTKLKAVGTPAVLATPPRTDLFYRSPSNVLTHAVRDGAAWKEESLGRRSTSDPVAVRKGNETTVLSISEGLHPVLSVFAEAAPQGIQRTLSVGPRVAGIPALARGQGSFQIYVRGVDGSLHLLEATSIAEEAQWSDTTLAAVTTSFPLSFHLPDGTDRAYFYDADGLVEVARGPGTSGWTSKSIAPGTTAFSGTPAGTLIGDALKLYVRNQQGSVHTFWSHGATWASDVLQGKIRDSMVAADGRVFATDVDGRLVLNDGWMFVELGAP